LQNTKTHVHKMTSVPIFLYWAPFNLSRRPGDQKEGPKSAVTRGGHRHLQIGRMLDIDLISEPPHAPSPRCMYPKCENLVARGAGSDS
jgi:hypothetical protein